jgi:hypothetical protein
MIIAVDFDGTCTTHDYPKIGKYIGAQPILKELVKQGHQLILYSMRGDAELSEAQNWFVENDIELYGVNTNPTQHEWTQSPKAYAQLYIDDTALGVPLCYDKNFHGRPFVDWNEVLHLLCQKGFIPKDERSRLLDEITAGKKNKEI